MKVDNIVCLIDIISADDDPPPVRRVCALSIDGRSPALAALSQIKRENPEAYKKLNAVIRFVADRQERLGVHVKQGKGRRNDVFEIRAGQVRLFYFVDDLTRDVIVCTNTYWKAKSSAQEQDAAFAFAQRMKKLYLGWLRAQKGKL